MLLNLNDSAIGDTYINHNREVLKLIYKYTDGRLYNHLFIVNTVKGQLILRRYSRSGVPEFGCKALMHLKKKITSDDIRILTEKDKPLDKIRATFKNLKKKIS